MKALIVTLVLLCAACMPMLATRDDLHPLAPADEVWIHGYTRGIHDACVNASLAIVEEQAGRVSDQARYSIMQACQDMANDVQIRARSRMFYEEHYQPTPTPYVIKPEMGA